jgi:hypothetical protein
VDDDLFMKDLCRRVEWVQDNWYAPVGNETRAMPPLPEEMTATDYKDLFGDENLG